jgi:aminocarboxymuconate-semialdehyde decarboxylase
LKIDIHAHTVSLEMMRQMQAIDARSAPRIEHGSEYDTLIIEGATHYPRFPRGGYDLDTRLEAMERMGVDAQAVSQVPQTFQYRLEPKLGLEFSQIINEGLADLKKRYPGKFYPLASVPLQDPELAAQELERAVKQLGLHGVETGTNVRGKNLDDPSLEPFYRKLQELGCAWLIHPDSVAAMDRLGKYYLNNFIGNPLDTTIAVASLIFGGVFERYPKLVVCTCHGGGFVPYQYGRFDHGYGERDEPKEVIKKPPSEYLSHVRFDTITHSKPALEYLVYTFGPERVMLGTDYPFDMGLTDPVSLIEGLRATDAAGKVKIMGGNAAALLGLS